MFKQETIKRPDREYGLMKKCVLSIFGRGQYSVAYFRNADDLKTDDVADFRTRKAAIASIDHFIL